MERLAEHLKWWAQHAARNASGEFMVEREDKNNISTDEEEDDSV